MLSVHQDPRPYSPIKLGKETASFFQEGGTHTKSTLNLNWAEIWEAVPLCQRGFLACYSVKLQAVYNQVDTNFRAPSIGIKERGKWLSGAVCLSSILYWRKGTFELFTKCLAPVNGYSIPRLSCFYSHGTFSCLKIFSAFEYSSLSLTLEC